MFLLGLCGFAYAQNIQIKGTVTSATDSYPIIGASVVDKADKTNGTITDIDGNFTLTVKPGSEITFSYIGYKTLTLKAETSMSVIMHEDSEMLQGSRQRKCRHHTRIPSCSCQFRSGRPTV